MTSLPLLHLTKLFRGFKLVSLFHEINFLSRNFARKVDNGNISTFIPPSKEIFRPGKTRKGVSFYYIFDKLCFGSLQQQQAYLKYKSTRSPDFIKTKKTSPSFLICAAACSLDAIKTHNPNDLLLSAKLFKLSKYLQKFRFMADGFQSEESFGVCCAGEREKFHNKIHHLASDKSLSS